MSTTVRLSERLIIAVIDGSPRRESSSRLLAKHIVEKLSARGVEVRFFRQDEHLLPTFDDDRNSAHHPAVQRLFACMKDIDAVVLSSPEYHNGMSAALKNALDWLSLAPKENCNPMLLCGLIGGGGAMGNSGALLQMMMAVRSMKWWLMPDVMLSVPHIWEAVDSIEIRQETIAKRADLFVECLFLNALRFKSLQVAEINAQS